MTMTSPTGDDPGCQNLNSPLKVPACACSTPINCSSSFNGLRKCGSCEASKKVPTMMGMFESGLWQRKLSGICSWGGSA